MRTLVIKKGEQTNKLQVLRDLLYDNQEVETLFEIRTATDWSGSSVQVAAKDFKVTLIIENYDK